MATREKYSHKIADAKKRRKCTEAEVRQKVRDARSDKDQLVKLNDNGFRATKERGKLGARN